jgi:hypothetical protein
MSQGVKCLSLPPEPLLAKFWLMQTLRSKTFIHHNIFIFHKDHMIGIKREKKIVEPV